MQRVAFGPQRAPRFAARAGDTNIRGWGVRRQRLGSIRESKNVQGIERAAVVTANVRVGLRFLESELHMSVASVNDDGRLARRLASPVGHTLVCSLSTEGR
jgi:hypothetical protein